MKLRNALLLLLVACSTVPITGRRRLASAIPLDQQMSLGAQAYEEMLAGEKVIRSGPEAEMVRRIGRKIAKNPVLVAEFPEAAEQFEWEFVLVDDPEMVNAWALPGGKTAVYTGLFEVATSEELLAAVMGHEIAHAVVEHGAERMTQAGLAQAGLAASGLLISDENPERKQMVLALLGAGAQVGLLLPFNRTQESEADELGTYFMAAAGYDPRAALTLWQRMAEGGGPKPPEWLSTHPADATRIQRLEALMPKAVEYYEQSSAGR